jgi:hypothetical protein
MMAMDLASHETATAVGVHFVHPNLPVAFVAVLEACETVAQKSPARGGALGFGAWLAGR